jgi:peroxiredoxin
MSEGRGRRYGISQGEIIFITLLIIVGLSYAGWLVYRQMVRREPVLPPALASLAQPDVAAAARAYVRKNKPTALSGELNELLANPQEWLVPTQQHPLLGKPAPRFKLLDHLGRAWTLDEALKKGPVVVVFYYGYHCDHCVSQLFDLSEDIRYFQELSVEVVAISPDPAAVTQEKYGKYGPFAFPVLSDEDHAVAQRYGCAWKPPGSDGFEQKHGCFVINPAGVVTWVNTGDEPFTGNRTLLYELRRAKGQP